jgi:hypothetical protein
MNLRLLRELVSQVPQAPRDLLARIAEGVSSVMQHARKQVARYAASVALFDETPSSAGRITNTFHAHPPLLVIREPGTPIDWIVQGIRTRAHERSKTLVFRPNNFQVNGQTTMGRHNNDHEGALSSKPAHSQIDSEAIAAILLTFRLV